MITSEIVDATACGARGVGLLNIEDATAAIREHLARQYPSAEVWGAASFDERIDLWIATVSLAPSGPLLRMSFGLSLSRAEVSP